MKKIFFAVLTCMYIYVGIQQANAQEYAIGVYNKSYNEGATVGVQSFINAYGRAITTYQKGVLFQNSGNEIAFFLYEKPKINGKENIISEITPAFRFSISKGIVLPSSSPAGLVVVSTELGQTTITVTCEFKNTKISQEFVFEVVAVPSPTIVLLDEMGKKIITSLGENANGKTTTKLDAVTLPKSIEAIVIYDKVFARQCQKDMTTQVSFKMVLARGSMPIVQIVHSGKDSKKMDFATLNIKQPKTGDALIFAPTLTRFNFRGEILNDVQPKDKYIQILVK